MSEFLTAVRRPDQGDLLAGFRGAQQINVRVKDCYKMFRYEIDLWLRKQCLLVKTLAPVIHLLPLQEKRKCLI